MERRVVCIAGMHRSGTSMLADWLEACGLRIDNGRMVRPAQSNVRGHFEDADFMELQGDSILRQLPNSKGWIVRPGEDVEFDGAEMDAARRLIEAREQYDLWGWKDPRSTVFLRQWAELIDNLKVVANWRPARQVVSSLLRRAAASDNPDIQLDRGAAVSMWLRYNQALLEHKMKYPDETVVHSLDTVIATPRESLVRINDLIGGGLEFQPLPYEGSLMRRDAAVRRLGRIGREVEQVERALAEISVA